VILKHDADAPLSGLDTIAPDKRPPVAILFWSFRIMVGLGFAMLGLGVWSLIARARKRLYDAPWLHRAAVLMGPSGFIAVIAGWTTTEVGRQPYTVYGLLTTAESRSPIAAPAVGASLLAFVLIYTAVFGVGIWYLLKMMHAAPHAHEEPLEAVGLAPIRTAGPIPELAT
jgi:cytochrome d ubiquinol oxidase subunit I